jgi:hypothetical protein
MDSWLFRVPAADLGRLLRTPEAVDAYLFAEGTGRLHAAPGDSLDLAREWHALNYVLTGDPTMDVVQDADQPLGFLFGGGGCPSLGLPDSPCFAAPPGAVVAIAEALARVDPGALRGRLDQALAAEVYPRGWSLDPDAEWSLQELIDRRIPELRGFVGEAAVRGLGLIHFVSV